MSIIEDIFQVTADSTDTRDYTHFQSDNLKWDRFTTEDIDSLLLYQLTENDLLANHLSYLNDCFQRCQQQKRLNKNSSSAGS